MEEPNICFSFCANVKLLTTNVITGVIVINVIFLFVSFNTIFMIIIINQVFRRKTLVIKMMNVGREGGGGGWGGWSVAYNLLPEHNSATIRNILLIFGRIIEQVNAE